MIRFEVELYTLPKTVAPTLCQLNYQRSDIVLGFFYFLVLLPFFVHLSQTHGTLLPPTYLYQLR